MKLIISGGVTIMGHHAPINTVYEDLNSLLHKKTYQGINDVFLEVLELNEREIKFDYSYFEEPNIYQLKVGEKATYRKDGNSFVLEVHFALEE
ncbi:MAG: hypothetical protein K5694_00945 [Bacilli bacterium]|nr:hypothetical protein [Bacilli bacterium]